MDLRALVQDFSDAKVAAAVELLNTFAKRHVNAEFPPWFYATFTAVKLVAQVKTWPEGGAKVPDVRPLGVGKCLRRAINTALLSNLIPACAEHFRPQKVAVGIPGGITLLVLGLRALLELHPDWVVVRLDIHNTFNEIKRVLV